MLAQTVRVGQVMRLVFASILFSISAAALAAEPIIATPEIPGNCQVTPTTPGAAGSYPGADQIISSSKLVQYAGKPLPAEGQVVYLYGRVLSEDCKPIPDATVELWQADITGKYTRATKAQLASVEPVFTGSGRASTNNAGEYQFETLFPSPYSQRAPHLHLRIAHPDHPTLQTEVFFENDQRNDADSTLNAVSADLRPRLMATVKESGTNPGALEARFDIVLMGKSRFKTY
jgi:protocatechuate 3,4-dioxygenase, beta subunit